MRINVTGMELWDNNSAAFIKFIHNIILYCFTSRVHLEIQVESLR